MSFDPFLEQAVPMEWWYSIELTCWMSGVQVLTRVILILLNGLWKLNFMDWTLDGAGNMVENHQWATAIATIFFHVSVKWGICKSFFQHLSPEAQWFSWLRQSLLWWRSWVQIPTQLWEFQSGISLLNGAMWLIFSGWYTYNLLGSLLEGAMCSNSLGWDSYDLAFRQCPLHLIALCPISLTGVKLKQTWCNVPCITQRCVRSLRGETHTFCLNINKSSYEVYDTSKSVFLFLFYRAVLLPNRLLDSPVFFH